MRQRAGAGSGVIGASVGSVLGIEENLSVIQLRQDESDGVKEGSRALTQALS